MLGITSLAVKDPAAVGTSSRTAAQPGADPRDLSSRRRRYPFPLMNPFICVKVKTSQVVSGDSV